MRARPFPVTIQGVGAFGGRDPRVLWAGVEAGEPLDALYRANERAARAAGLEPEGRAFKPHVTLARMRGARQQAVARFLQENGGLRTRAVHRRRASCCCRRGPGTGGAPYVVEAEFPFEEMRTFEGADQARRGPSGRFGPACARAAGHRRHVTDVGD